MKEYLLEVEDPVLGFVSEFTTFEEAKSYADEVGGNVYRSIWESGEKIGLETYQAGAWRRRNMRYAIIYSTEEDEDNRAMLYAKNEGEAEILCERMSGTGVELWASYSLAQQRPSVLLRKLGDGGPSSRRAAITMHAACYTSWLALRMGVTTGERLLIDSGLLHETAHWLAYGTTYRADTGALYREDDEEVTTPKSSHVLDDLCSRWALLEEAIPGYLPVSMGGATVASGDV